jgi:hypothetical protein
MQNNFHKILICAPTASAKNYCFDAWIDNVMSFTYPNFEIRLFDNTLDNGVNAKYLNEKFYSKYGKSDKFLAQNSMVLHSIKKDESVISRMCVSHNDCRDYMLNNRFDIMLHLETDVFPQKDIIEELLFANKSVVGGLYYRDSGKNRIVMLQHRLYRAKNYAYSKNFEVGEDVSFVDGTVKKSSHVGLGCVLIKKSVFNKIKFRFVPNENNHPDSYFAEDCFRNKIQIYAHTGCVARHENKSWGKFGIDYK